MIKPQSIKRYENLVRNLTADQIQAIVEAQSIEEVKELMNKPDIQEKTAKAYQTLIRNYYRATIAETPTRRETRLANVNPQLTEEVRLMNAEMQRLREENERQRQLIEEMQRRMEQMEQEMERLRQAQQAQTEDESNQRMIEESNTLEQAWLDQQGYETEQQAESEPESEPELDLEFEDHPEPKIERYVRKGENIIRIDQTPTTGYDLSYFKDFGNVEESRLKIKMDIRLPEENKTISIYKDLGKIESTTQAKDLVESEIDYQGGKYGGIVIGTRIYIVS